MILEGGVVSPCFSIPWELDEDLEPLGENFGWSPTECIYNSLPGALLYIIQL